MRLQLTLLVLTLSATAVFPQEWVRQHPFAGFAPLHAVTFDANGNGWAVGQQTLILHTSNWGEIWTVQNGLPIGYTLQAVEIVPGTNAQTVIAGGPGLFITHDGGTNWSFLSTGQSLDGVKRIQCFDAQNWIASGISYGARTTDGGQNWTVFDMPDNSARGTWFNDPNNGWAGSGNFNNQQIYKTTDGGVTWDLADAEIYPIITDITMLDNNTGFMSARDYMYKTTDGGSTWIKLHNDVQPSLTGMHVVNENIVCSGLNNGFIFYTVNGGTDWAQINPNVINSNQILDVFAEDDGRIWVPGKYASVQYSMDDGQTWSDQTPGSKNTLLDVEFRNNTGFAVGSEGGILSTTNGGAIWEDVGYDPQSTYLSLSLYAVPGEGHIYLGASNGNVVHKSLADMQWETIGQGLGQVHALYAMNTQVLLAGTIGNIYRTTDGGASWMSVATTQNAVEEFVFPTPQTGYVSIQDGRILKSVDGGASWNPVLEKDNSYRFTGLHFQNTMRGWAVAEFKDSVFTTQDGGNSWDAYKLPANTFWKDVAFMDADTGYISGGSAGSGIILRTTNGGQTWSRDFDDTESLQRMYVRPGEDYVWVVGFGGNILHYSPCAVAPAISDLTGDISPCEGEISVYEVGSAGATVFTWTVPAGWTIIGNDNSARIDVLVGPANGEVTIQAANSCGTQTAKLTINVSSMAGGEVSIAEMSGTLSTDLTGVTYQWLKDEVEIPGATNALYTPSVSGLYTLVVTFPNGCTAVSNAIMVIISGVRDVQSAEIQVFPNPASDIIFWHSEVRQNIIEIQIYDRNGNMVQETKETANPIQISDLPAGIYLLRVRTDDSNLIGRFIKN